MVLFAILPSAQLKWLAVQPDDYSRVSGNLVVVFGFVVLPSNHPSLGLVSLMPKGQRSGARRWHAHGTVHVKNRPTCATLPNNRIRENPRVHCCQRCRAWLRIGSRPIRNQQVSGSSPLIGSILSICKKTI